MRKLFLFLILTIIPSICFSQEHLKFMGIPISGNVTQFVSKLKAKGFVSSTVPSGTDYKKLKGDFANENSIVNVYYNQRTSEVYQVVVGITSDQYISTKQEEDLKSKMERFRNDLPIKYGNAKLTEISNKEIQFDLDEGTISIVRTDVTYGKNAVLLLTYRDFQSAAKLYSSIMDDLKVDDCKFLGIPINSTLQTFTNKLISKKFTVSKSKASQGEKLFDGVFANETVLIRVTYKNAKTEGVNVFFLNEGYKREKHKKFLQMYATLYPDAKYLEVEDNDFFLVCGPTVIKSSYTTGFYVLSYFPTSLIEKELDKRIQKSYDDL